MGSGTRPLGSGTLNTVGHCSDLVLVLVKVILVASAPVLVLVLLSWFLFLSLSAIHTGTGKDRHKSNNGGQWRLSFAESAKPWRRRPNKDKHINREDRRNCRDTERKQDGHNLYCPLSIINDGVL